MAERGRFELPVPLRVRLISSQVPSTTRPPLHSLALAETASPSSLTKCRDYRRSRKKLCTSSMHRAASTPLLTST